MAKLRIKEFASVRDARNHFLERVADICETARAAWGTVGAGQAMAYAVKYQEAVRYPTAGPFPYLEEEAQALALPVAQVAESVLAERKRWDTRDARIEGMRLQTKALVRKASAPEEMYAAVEKLRKSLACEFSEKA